jgi:hypothetical protein
MIVKKVLMVMAIYSNGARMRNFGGSLRAISQHLSVNYIKKRRPWAVDRPDAEVVISVPLIVSTTAQRGRAIQYVMENAQTLFG